MSEAGGKVTVEHMGGTLDPYDGLHGPVARIRYVGRMVGVVDIFPESAPIAFLRPDTTGLKLSITERTEIAAATRELLGPLREQLLGEWNALQGEIE